MDEFVLLASDGARSPRTPKGSQDEGEPSGIHVASINLSRGQLADGLQGLIDVDCLQRLWWLIGGSRETLWKYPWVLWARQDSTNELAFAAHDFVAEAVQAQRIILWEPGSLGCKEVVGKMLSTSHSIIVGCYLFRPRFLLVVINHCNVGYALL